MDRIRSWYNQNRKIIFLGIIVITVIIFLFFILIREIRKNTEKQTRTQISEINTNTLNSIALPTNKSVVTGENINTTQKEITVLDDFILYCNSKKIEEAYALLSEDCKNELYPSIQDFFDNYYKVNFNGQLKNVKVENWGKNTYKVNIAPDALATGKYDIKDTLQDYITIVEDSENNPKINISNYIGREVINKAETSNGIEIKVIQKDTYMDYEYYTFEIKNNNKIMLKVGDLENFYTSYLEDKNGMKYQAYMHELLEDDLRVNAGESKKLKIKYFNQYSSTREIVNIVFSNLKTYIGDNYTTIKIDM